MDRTARPGPATGPTLSRWIYRFGWPLPVAVALLACDMSQTVAGVPGVDAATAPEPDATIEPIPDPFAGFEWTAITPPISDLGAGLHYVSADEIYVIADRRIYRWDGSQWASHSIPRPAITQSMHFLAPNKIYAVVGDKVARWSGVLYEAGAWTDFTQPMPGINHDGAADLHVVSETEVYAVVDGKIRRWDGHIWRDATYYLAGLSPAMQFVSPTEIYAIADERVVKWTGRFGSGGRWVDLTYLLDGIGTALHVVSDQEIYAVADESIALWNGSQWLAVTSELAGLRPVFALEGIDDIVAVSSDAVVRWSPLPPG